MAKKSKSRRAQVSQKTIRRSVNKFKSRKIEKTPSISYTWLFVKALLIAVFAYGLYVIWSIDWINGLSIITGVLLVYLLIKLFFKLKRK